MGTRGLYAYKWKGRYYIHYNHYDSYPEGLGNILVANVPSNHAKYRNWLQATRGVYSDVEEDLDRNVFTMSLQAACEGKVTPNGAWRVELETLPSYDNVPERNDFIEWVYVLDLDQEAFYVSDNAYFPLDKIPEDWTKLVEGLENCYSTASSEAGLAQAEENPTPQGATVDSAAAGISLLAVHQDSVPAYLDLHPSIVFPKQSSELSRRPVITVSRDVFDIIQEGYGSLLRKSRYTLSVEDFMFRETAFALLCICSGAPELLRMASRTQQTTETMKAPFAMLHPSSDSFSDTEFVSGIFRGYHMADVPPGSSPATRSYWLEGVFVYLTRDIASEKGVKKAIVEAVKCGRADSKTTFNAIVTSIMDVVLIRVTENGVQHTKKLRLVDAKHQWHQRAFDWLEEIYDASPDLNLGEEQEVLEWNETEPVDTLLAIAQVFEATAREGLKPSGVSRGRFPSEIYRKILEQVDPATRSSCRTVSRAFRDIASEIYCMSDGLSLVARPVPLQPECYHRNAGDFGPFKLSESSVHPHITQWYPVIGHSNGTASFLSRCSLGRSAEDDSKKQDG